MEFIEKIPPHNIEAEQAVLGSILIDGESIVKVADTLAPEDFYKDSHQKIYSVMLKLFEQKEPIDVLSVSDKLEELNLLKEIGGKTYIAELTTILPSSAHLEGYADIVKKKSTLRKLINISNKILELCFKEEDRDIQEIIDKSEQLLLSVSQRYQKQRFVPISNVLIEAFERIDELHKNPGKLRGIPTGFPDLDNILAGLQRADLIILAARPSVGKTTLALDIARNSAILSKTKVGIFSLEMSKEQLVDRLICAQAGIELWKMRTGKLSSREDIDDFPKIGEAIGILSEVPIFIDDSPTLNVMEIRSKARRIQIEHGLDLLIIDYLQLLEGRNSENRVQEIAEITRSLKSLARELNVPVLALSQLSRAVEQRSPAIPKLADLRESGSIEQDADVVIFIYRKAMDKGIKECPIEEKNIAELHIAKHRNGPTGIVKLFFDEKIVTFKNLEK